MATWVMYSSTHPHIHTPPHMGHVFIPPHTHPPSRA